MMSQLQSINNFSETWPDTKYPALGNQVLLIRDETFFSDTKLSGDKIILCDKKISSHEILSGDKKWSPRKKRSKICEKGLTDCEISVTEIVFIFCESEKRRLLTTLMKLTPNADRLAWPIYCDEFCKNYATICCYDDIVNTSSWNHVAELSAHRGDLENVSPPSQGQFLPEPGGWGRRSLTFFILWTTGLWYLPKIGEHL